MDDSRRKIAVLIIGAVALVGGRAALAGRCGDNNPSQCGLDSQTEPPNLGLGGAGGCTEASIAQLPMFQGTHMCRPGETTVMYDLDQPFPNNGVPGDASIVGEKSFLTLRAGPDSPCAHMADTVDPKVCPDRALCPDPGAPQPEGAIKVPVRGYVVACWSPLDHDGCRDVWIPTKSMCLHAEHQALGPGCGTTKDGIDCANVSTEQIAIDVPGATNRRLCPPIDPATSCRGTRPGGRPGMRFWIGGACTTNNCENPGTAPVVGEGTCNVAWGAWKLGYNKPAFEGINEPGWYDWKTGAFRVAVSSPKPTCGALGACMGVHAGVRWDTALVAVPRSGQPLPCVGSPGCDPAGCFP